MMSSVILATNDQGLAKCAYSVIRRTELLLTFYLNVQDKNFFGEKNHVGIATVDNSKTKVCRVLLARILPKIY
jgi:hypothetical protein